MKKITLIRVVSILTLLLFGDFDHAKAINIAPMTWTTGRSDWINVMTDSAMTIHATGNGTTDDAPALQQALNLASAKGAARTTVYLPAGTYTIMSTLYWNKSPIQKWTGSPGLWLVGCGSNTTIKWAGAAGQPMLLDQGSSRSHYEGLVWNAGPIGAAAGFGVAHVSLNYQTRMRHENEAFIGFSGTSGTGTINYPYAYTLTSGKVSTTTTLPVGVTVLPLASIPTGLVVGAGITGQGIPTDSVGNTTTTITAIDPVAITITISAPTNHTIGNLSSYNFCSSVPGNNPETVPAAGIFAGSARETQPMDATMIWNCLFQNDTVGVMVGYEKYNNYMWIFKSCEFDTCGTGIHSGDGKSVIMDTHFSGSTLVDIQSGYRDHIRRCTSSGSKQFITTSATSWHLQDVVEDCWIDGWTTVNGAITFNDISDMAFDCTFTHPPTGAVGAIYMTPANPIDLTLSNNYTSSTTMPLTYIVPGKTLNTVNVPSGSLPSDLTSPAQTFLQSTWASDGPTILDITQPPYNAVRGTDCTTAIQNAITQAKTNNNGTVVYIPNGTFNTSGTLTVSGGNYAIQGSGYNALLKWTGASPTTIPMFTVTTPQDITIEQLQAQIAVVSGTSTQPCISETSTGASSATYDEVFSANYTVNPGIVLTSLPTGSFVFMPITDTWLTVKDCGPAGIFADYLLDGITVSGATQPKTGFLGVLAMENVNGVFPSQPWSIIIDDNQDFVASDYYSEQCDDDLLVENTHGASWTGRVSLQALKEESNLASTTISIQNYGGRVFYGSQDFNNNGGNSLPVITQSGSAPVDLVLAGNYYMDGNPTYPPPGAFNLIELNKIFANPTTYAPNVQPTGWGASTAAGLDHLRQANAYDLMRTYDWVQGVSNTVFETDPPNATPLTTLGTAPAQWTVTGTIATGGGVRDVCAVSGGSPFGPGTQSAAFVDSTASNTGTRLVWNQSLTGWSASQGCVFTFDFQMKPVLTGSTSNLWIRLFTGTQTPFELFLWGGGLGNNTTGNLVAYQGGVLNHSLAPLTVGTWYRVRAVVPPPSTGGSVTLYLTPWTSTGPGTTSLPYTIDGEVGTSATGFELTQFNLNTPLENTNVNFDNITVNSNPLFAFP